MWGVFGMIEWGELSVDEEGEQVFFRDAEWEECDVVLCVESSRLCAFYIPQL